MTDNIDKILDKVQKLLALAGNNPSEAEAQAAALKAQALIAEYNLDMDALSDDERKEAYELIAAVHANNEGYRKTLSAILAPNFRCKAIIIGNTVHFFGHKTDVHVCVEIFNRLYRVSHNIGLKLEREARAAGRSTAGVANSYWQGFMHGIKDALGAQSVALAVIVPQDVKDEFQTRYNPKPCGGGVRMKGYAPEAYNQGIKDGKDQMTRRSIQ